MAARALTLRAVRPAAHRVVGARALSSGSGKATLTEEDIEAAFSITGAGFGMHNPDQHFTQRPLPEDEFAGNIMATTDGDDVFLNWSLLERGVTPIHKAYRNMDWKTYVRHTVGRRDGRAVRVERTFPESVPVYEVDSANLDEDMPWFQFDDLHKAVTKTISYSKGLFVADGAVGSSRAADRRVRVVTDDADATMAVQALLHRIPSSFPKSGPYQIRVVATSEPVADAMEGEPFAATRHDAEGGESLVIISGCSSPQVIQEQILRAMAVQGPTPGAAELTLADEEQVQNHEGIRDWNEEQKMLIKLAAQREAGVLPLRCDAYTDGAATTLVFGADSPLMISQLFAAKGVALASTGVASLFGGLAVPAGGKPAAGDVVLNDLAFRALRTPNAVPAPSRVIFVNAGSRSVAPVAPDKVADLAAAFSLAGAGTEAATEQATAFAERLHSSGAQVFEAPEGKLEGALFE